jgi:hypothetical protein
LIITWSAPATPGKEEPKHMTELPHDLCSPVEAAHIAEVSMPTLTRAVRHGELHIYRLDPLTPGSIQAKATHFSRAAVKRWRNERKAGK